MEKMIMFFISLSILSCNQTKNVESKDKINNLSSLLKQNKDSTNNLIFLNYWIKMSEKEFKEQTENLMELGKLKTNSEKRLIYNIKYAENDQRVNIVEGIVSPYFFKNELYQIILFIKPEKEVSSDDYFIKNPELNRIRFNMLNLYEKKYGKFESILSLVDGEDYFWKKNGKEIKITIELGHVRIYYTDLKLEKKMRENRKQDLDNELKNVINDI